MNSMTVQERLDDISRRCGYSDKVIRAVLKASAESAVDSLSTGRKALIPYLCKMRPIFKRKVLSNGDTGTVLQARLDAVESIQNKLEPVNDLSEMDIEPESEFGIRSAQIEALM